MSFHEFTTTFPGTHVTSWTDDEGFDMVTVGVPGVETSLLFTTEYDEVLRVWDMIDGHVAPVFSHPLYAALDDLMERQWAEEHAGAGDTLNTYFTNNAL
jgi:hypothetical protein